MSGDGTDGGGSSGRSTLKLAGGALLVVVLLVVAAYFLGVIGAPSAGLQDRGDWGNVSEERTEVVTTIWVDNPNPIGITLGDSLTADYDVAFNGVRVATGDRTGISIPTGNSTLQLRTFILNDKLDEWWVTFVRQNETIRMDINGTLTLNAGATVTHDIQRNQTVLNESTPLISTMSRSADRLNGTYTRSVSAGSVTNDSLLDGDSGDVTVGYEVVRGSADWGNVTQNETTVLFTFVLRNPGDVPVPAVPEGIGLSVDMNDVRFFQADSGELSGRNVGQDDVIPPGETRTVVLAVRMDNDKVDEWFTSHVRRDERTTVSTSMQLVFEVPATGTTLRAPRDGPVTYDCEFQTAILVDNQTSSTTCGEGGSVGT